MALVILCTWYSMFSSCETTYLPVDGFPLSFLMEARVALKTGMLIYNDIFIFIINSRDQTYYLKAKHPLSPIVFYVFVFVSLLSHSSVTTIRHTRTHQKTHTRHFPPVVSQPLNYTHWLIDHQPGAESFPGEIAERERRLVRHNRNGSGLNDVLSIKKIP